MRARLSYFLLRDIARLFYGAPGGFVRIFFRGAGGNKHECGTTTLKGIGPAVTSFAGSASPIVSRLEAASLRHRRISGLRTLVLIRTRLCLFAPPCKVRLSPLSLYLFRAFFSPAAGIWPSFPAFATRSPSIGTRSKVLIPARSARSLARDDARESHARDQVQFVANGKSVIGCGMLYYCGSKLRPAKQDRKPHDRVANARGYLGN